MRDALVSSMAASFRATGFRAKSFRLPSAAELLSLCVAKEKVTKEKGHPAWRLPGILPGKSVSRGRAFRQGILPWRKGADIPVGSRCAACRPRLTASEGPPAEQRASCAYFSEQQDQKRRAEQHSAQLLRFRFRSCSCLRLCSCCQALHRVRARMARRSTGAPVWR